MFEFWEFVVLPPKTTTFRCVQTVPVRLENYNMPQSRDNIQTSKMLKRRDPIAK